MLVAGGGIGGVIESGKDTPLLGFVAFVVEAYVLEGLLIDDLWLLFKARS